MRTGDEWAGPQGRRLPRWSYVPYEPLTVTVMFTSVYLDLHVKETHKVEGEKKRATENSNLDVQTSDWVENGRAGYFSCGGAL